MQYEYRKGEDGCLIRTGGWGGGQRQPSPPQLRIWQGLWRKSLGFVPHPDLGPSVRLSAWQTVWPPLISFMLVLPPSQRILFSTAQMFEAVRCAALSCVYNKEVLVWRRREGSEVGEWMLLRRGGGHRAVGVNTGWCQLSLGASN